MSRLLAAVLIFGFAVVASATELPEGYMQQDETDAILAKALHIHLNPDMSQLSDAERDVVGRLIQVGQIFQRLHEHMRHQQAVGAYQDLLALDEKLNSPQATQNLITMYYMAKGPIIRNLANDRVQFLPVEPRPKGRNVYPWAIEKAEIEAFLERLPESRSWLLGVRRVVRRSDKATIARDLETLDHHPVLDALHPGLRDLLDDLAHDPGDKLFYACPYSVAFSEPLMRSYALLMEAGDIIEQEDPEFAGYLRNRARDLLSDDYESGDASWVTGRFNNLNAQIGSYEVYDDNLYGVKSFFGMNVLVRDKARSDALGAATKHLQRYENLLPYEPVGWDGSGNKKNVRGDIPVGVYNIAADFGQSRGTNTATILPNESEHARKYGRTILLRYNIMTNQQIFAARMDAFSAAVHPDFASDLTSEGGFNRTLWHEVGHYLGVDRTHDGRDLGEALETSSSTYEELKADLVSLFLAPYLLEDGYYDAQQQRAHYSDGVRRVLLKNKPSPSQAYQTMELMQMNFYLEKGLLEFDNDGKQLIIHHDRYHAVVTDMLEQVLALQYAGDLARANAFINRYAVWEDAVQGELARAMKATEKFRYAYVTYEALEKAPAFAP